MNFVSAFTKEFKVWKEIKDTYKKIDAVNYFFDTNVKYRKEKVDHWQCLSETLMSGEGDCDDYAVAKYMTLLMLGIPSKDMYLMVIDNVYSDHLVLVVKGYTKKYRFFGKSFGKLIPREWVLDNMTKSVYDISETTYTDAHRFTLTKDRMSQTSKLGTSFAREETLMSKTYHGLV